MQKSRTNLNLQNTGSIDSESSTSESSLLAAACSIYCTYHNSCPDRTQYPCGVAVDRLSLRGKLIFAAKPILLPKEAFVPFSQIERAIGQQLLLS
nr:MAG: hypothetical protein EDM05_13630 [Leptolyngbya sp. IPPAS B-1204]